MVFAFLINIEELLRCVGVMSTDPLWWRPGLFNLRKTKHYSAFVRASSFPFILNKEQGSLLLNITTHHIVQIFSFISDISHLAWWWWWWWWWHIRRFTFGNTQPHRAFVSQLLIYEITNNEMQDRTTTYFIMYLLCYILFNLHNCFYCYPL